MESFVGLLVVLLIVIVALLLARLFLGVVTVHDYERGLRYRRGRFSGLVDPGMHITVPPLSEIRVLDGRPGYMPIDGQEVLTSDGVALKISLAARYVVGDPVAAITNDQSYLRALHLELQLALREVVAAGNVDAVLAERATIGAAIFDACGSKLARVGIELLSVDVRDLMVPGELKRLFGGVVAARKEGEATLERVRAETAALRNLANAGRLVEDNPGLLQLRMLQQIGATSGNTIMLSMPDGQAKTAKPNRASGTAPPTADAAQASTGRTRSMVDRAGARSRRPEVEQEPSA